MKTKHAARRGPKRSAAHKRWAQKRMDRPQRVAMIDRGRAKLMRLFGGAL